MKRNVILSVMMVMAVLSLTSVAKAVVVFSDDFDAYSDGDLNGQGGWAVYTGQESLDIGVPGNPGKSAFSDVAQDGGARGSVHAVAVGTIGDAPIVTVTAHVLPRSFSAVEIGGPGGTPGLAIEIASNTWFGGGNGGFRVEGVSPTQGVLNDAVDIDEDSWYELKIVIDRTAVNADFIYTNLTTNTVEQQFNDVNFVTTDAATGLNFVRLYSWGESRFDNVNVDAVPEPSSVILVVSAAIAAIGYAWRRKRA